jgi:F0F1-type ATP synthase membrane subunit b/b'
MGMGYLDRLRAKAEEALEKSKPIAEDLKAKSTPMAESLGARAKKMAQTAREAAEGFRDELHGTGEPEANDPATAPKTPEP